MNARNTGCLIGAAGAAAIGVMAGLALGRARRAAAKAAMVLTGDWEKQLKADHRAVRKLLKGMADSELTEPAKRSALLEALDDNLSRHALEEETVIYPALRTLGMTGAAKALVDDHADMRALVRELQELSPEDPVWIDAAKRLKQLIYRHVREEEQELFPALRERAPLAGGEERLTELVRDKALKLTS